MYHKKNTQRASNERNERTTLSDGLNRVGGGSWLSLIVCVFWVFLLAFGLVGLIVPYQRPLIAISDPDPPPVEVLEVELSQDSVPQSDLPMPSSELPNPPPLPEPIDPPAVASLTPVTGPSDLIAFALPVDPPSNGIDTTRAGGISQAAGQPAAHSSNPPVQSLSFGRGQGDQPEPRYPRQARRDGQEGTVTVVFDVGVNGQVTNAELSRPCAWPLLNQEALRVIQERWHFPPGTERRFEVSIVFQLAK